MVKKGEYFSKIISEKIVGCLHCVAIKASPYSKESVKKIANENGYLILSDHCKCELRKD